MAEASTFYLEIITPERQFYIGPAEALVFPAVDGEMGVYPGHEPAVTAVEPGELRYKVDGKWEPAAVGAGFVEIKPDYVILLVDTLLAFAFSFSSSVLPACAFSPSTVTQGWSFTTGICSPISFWISFK